jgi:hypothetical protein
MVEEASMSAERVYTCRFIDGPRDGLVQHGPDPPAEIRYPAVRELSGVRYHVYRRGLCALHKGNRATVFYEYVGVRILPPEPRPKRFSGQPD